MAGSRQRRLAMVATAGLAIAALFGAGAGAEPPSGEVSFTSVPSLFPDFSPQIHDYVVRSSEGR